MFRSNNSHIYHGDYILLISCLLLSIFWCISTWLGIDPVKGLLTKPVHDNPNGSFLPFLHYTQWESTRLFLFQISCFFTKWTYNSTVSEISVSSVVHMFSLIIYKYVLVNWYKLQPNNKTNREEPALFGCFQQRTDA